MIRKIELINFMSHRHTVIELADGLTVLTGPNNCGKSALVSALKILATNENSTYVTRHHEKLAQVIIELEDDTGQRHTLEWGRRNSPYYLIDGLRYDRLRNSGVPDSLHRLLKMPRVVSESSNDVSFDIHFGEQKSPMFLLDASGTQVAQFFGSSSEISYLLALQRLHRRRTQEAQAEAERLKSEVEAIDRQLEKLAPCEAIEKELKNVKREHQEILTLESGLQQLVVHRELLVSCITRTARHEAHHDRLKSVRPPPPLEDIRPLLAQTTLIQTSSRNAGVLQRLAEQLAGMAAPPPVEDTRPLRTCHAGMTQSRHRQRQLQDRAAILARLTPAPIPDDTQPLRSAIDALGSCQTAMIGAQRRAQTLQQTTTVQRPELQSLDGIQQTLALLATSEKNMRRLGRERKQWTRDHSALHEDWTNFIADHPDCPACGQPLPERIEGAHASGRHTHSADHPSGTGP